MKRLVIICIAVAFLLGSGGGLWAGQGQASKKVQHRMAASQKKQSVNKKSAKGSRRTQSKEYIRKYQGRYNK